jgi:hypothetical protein
VASTHHLGPFDDRSIVENMVVLQGLNGAAALTTLLLVAVVAERETTYRKIEEACTVLTEVVAGLAPPRSFGRTPTPPERGQSVSRSITQRNSLGCMSTDLGPRCVRKVTAQPKEMRG